MVEAVVKLSPTMEAHRARGDLGKHNEGSESRWVESGEHPQGFVAERLTTLEPGPGSGAGSAMTWRGRRTRSASSFALRLSDARSVATERRSLANADFIMAVPVVMCSRPKKLVWLQQQVTLPFCSRHTIVGRAGTGCLEPEQQCD